MATLFLDFENGNDNYGGTSFALLASGTDGRITTATFSSAGASFPNDGSLIGQYLSIFNGTIYAVYNITAWVSATSLTIAAISGGTALANQAVDRQYYIGGRWKNITTGATAVRTIPGDTIRMMGSPAPTSLGQNGVWTSQALQATKNLVSSTNATPIAVTVTAHGYATGDTVVITGHTTNTNANGTWEITVTGANTFTLDGSVGNGVGGASGTARLRNNTRVKLTTAVTQNIASTGPGRTAWTASANCSTNLYSSGGKEGALLDEVNMLLAFNTGKAAYWTLPATLNLSGYQQVSFWIQKSTSTINSGTLELRLCSDATGDVVVDTITIPGIPANLRWQPVTFDKGSALGSSIASVSLYVNTDVSTAGTVAISLSNIIACKASSAADSLTLTSLIGKNTTGETFWGIQSINGTRVMLDADTNATPTSTTVRGYYGTSETVTTWKRETIKLGPAASSTTALQTIQEGGTDGSPITYSGGWDRTAMSTQNLETWLDGVNGNGTGIQNTLSFTGCEKFAFCRFNRGYNQGGGVFQTFNFISASNCGSASNTGSFDIAGNSATGTIDFAVANLGAGISYSVNQGTITLSNQVSSNGSNGLIVNGGSDVSVIGAVGSLVANNGSAGFGANGSKIKVFALVTENNSSGMSLAATVVDVYLTKCLISDGNEVPISISNVFASAYSQNHDQTADNHKIFSYGALISSATDQRNTASGISWKIQPTNADRSASRPVVLSLAKVACAANSLVTVKAWMRRTNTGLTMRLVCKGGQIAGVTSDVVDAMTAAADTWAEQTITFTPTEVGVVEITAEAYGGTTFSGWVDDMTISQA